MTAILARLAALLVAVLSWPPAIHAERQPTTQTSIGIFYRPGAPETGSLWRDGDAGQRLYLKGRVLDVAGAAVAGARVELWHADTAGGVDESRYRATRRTGADGAFDIKTVLPGHIPMARDYPSFAPRHIHVVVTHPAHPRLVSMVYFRGDPLMEGSPYLELAVTLESARAGDAEVLIGDVELVLGAPPIPDFGYDSAD